MLTKMPTQEMIDEWKKIFEENRASLMPNRKTGIEIDNYLKTHYYVMPINTDKANKVVVENIMNNEPLKEKLPQGVFPCPVTYYVGDEKVFVGIDLVTGYFQCEEKGAEKIFDDLFAYRGLDEMDLKNYFLVAEYIKCTSR